MITLAHWITASRIFISPFFLVVYLEYERFGISATALPFILIFLMAISELSDAFDGFVARRYNSVTDLGKILDPMADSIARISVFLTFTQTPVNLPLLLIFVFIYRDSLISTLRTICALRGFALAARISGKIKAVIQGTAAFLILLMMIPYSLGQMAHERFMAYSFWVTAAAAFYTVYSAIDYIVANRYYIKKILNSGRE